MVGQHRSWGLCLADLDGNGRMDFYLPQHLDPPAIFLAEDNGFRAVFPRGLSGFAKSDHHGACVIDATGDGCPEIHQVVGAGGGTDPERNWFLESDCLRRVRDRAEEAGLSDPPGRGRLPIWLDVDVDGVADVLVLNESGGGPSLLLQGDGNGTYHDIGEAWGLPSDTGWTSGVASDLDLDGDPDLVLCGKRVVIFENIGDAFVEVTELEVVGIPRAIAGDLNGDRIPDLAVVTRGAESNLVASPLPGHLKYKLRTQGETALGFDWHSNADSVWLAPVAGFDYRVNATFLGGGSSIPDSLPCRIAADDPRLFGTPDLLGQTAGTFLWRDPDGTWHIRIVGESQGGELQFESARGWLHLDSPLENLTAVMFEPSRDPGAPNYLFQGRGDLTFQDVSETSGFRDGSRQSRDVTAADLDNDSDMDLVVANGAIVHNQRNGIYLNDGDGNFIEFAGWLGIKPDPLGTTETIGAADLNDDGFLELVFLEGHSGHPFVGGMQVYTLMEGAHHWLGVDVGPSRRGHTALGARVRVRAGNVVQEREFNAGQTHYSQDDPRLFFGLGEISVVDSLVVHWGSGETIVATQVLANRMIHTDDLPAR